MTKHHSGVPPLPLKEGYVPGFISQCYISRIIKPLFDIEVKNIGLVLFERGLHKLQIKCPHYSICSLLSPPRPGPGLTAPSSGGFPISGVRTAPTRCLSLICAALASIVVA